MPAGRPTPRVTIGKAAPKAKEAIKYRMPTFVLNGNLFHFAAYQNHIGLYPVPRGVTEFKHELAASCPGPPDRAVSGHDYFEKGG